MKHAPSAYGGSPSYNKHQKPGKNTNPMGSNKFLRFLLVILGMAYIGLVAYYRSVLHARDIASQHDVATLQSALTNIQDRLEEKTAVAKEAQAALMEKEADLARAERRLGNMETVEHRLSDNNLIQALQQQNLLFNHLRYGEGPARVVMEMAGEQDGTMDEVELELAPFDQMPHVTHWFLTLVETGYWDGCAIIRNAHHVMQLNCHGRTAANGNSQLLARVGETAPQTGKIPGSKSIVFQEFNEAFNHVAFTLGVAGRPGGEDFYINLMDNMRSHGPGGQGPEADPCFAKVVRGKEVLQNWHGKLGDEFLTPENFVQIKRAYIK